MDRPTVPDVAPLVRALYDRPGGGVGCCLHIVLDDQNVATSHVQFCLDTAIQHGHADCERLARLLLAMTRTQRLKLSDLVTA